ncbi:MAG: hypothetical protein Q4D58_02150 [Synergistaceae bacterium]|nr:hypothetical protein [Synergistaceae bacterium]
MEMIIMLLSTAAFMCLIVCIALLFMGIEECFHRTNKNNLHLSIFALFRVFIRCSLCLSSEVPAALRLSGLSLCAVFLFIPMGSLPPFFSSKAGLFLIIGLLLLAQDFYIRGLKKYSVRVYVSLDRERVNMLFKFAFALLVAVVTMAWYVINTGIPGSIFNISTYSAMPISDMTDVWGKLGMLFFFMSLSVISPCRVGRCDELSGYVSLLGIFDAVHSTLYPAIITALFLPWNISAFMKLTGLSMYLADFIFFWLKVFIVQAVLIPPIRAVYLDLWSMLPFGHRGSPYVFFSCGGVLLFMAELYL